MTRHAFGPNLRRIRVQRGISLAQIADATRISVQLLDGLERNDLTGWPRGIYARAYVRQYAYAIDVDPDTTVDEFCRWFPQGDRRAEAVVRGHAEIVDHKLAWQDRPAGEVERRGQAPRSGLGLRSALPFAGLGAIFMRLRRAFGKT
jgi:transcriptional regulator with XRE-family HTH domain